MFNKFKKCIVYRGLMVPSINGDKFAPWHTQKCDDEACDKTWVHDWKKTLILCRKNHNLLSTWNAPWKLDAIPQKNKCWCSGNFSGIILNKRQNWVDEVSGKIEKLSEGHKSSELTKLLQRSKRNRWFPTEYSTILIPLENHKAGDPQKGHLQIYTNSRERQVQWSASLEIDLFGETGQ